MVKVPSIELLTKKIREYTSTFPIKFNSKTKLGIYDSINKERGNNLNKITTIDLEIKTLEE